MRKANTGFTLIELLVVVAIIAILALIVLLAINPVEMQRKSRDSRRLSDLGTLRRAIDLSLVDGQALPDTGGTFITVDTTTVVTSFGGSMNISKYLSVAPQDPSYENSATTIKTVLGTSCTTTPDTTDTAKSAMAYKFNSDGNVYVLTALIESKDNCAIPSGDGGPNDALYELGTAPLLIVP